jgi:hypothetical protein
MGDQYRENRMYKVPEIKDCFGKKYLPSILTKE